MEQKDYYYEKGMQYEFDCEACHAAIEHYIKIHNKRRLGFDDEVAMHFQYETNDIDKFSSRQVGEIRRYCKNGEWSGSGKRPALDETMLFYFKKLGLFFGNEMLFLKPVYSTMGSISEQLKYFYSQFNNILYHLSDSDYFVTNPSTGEFGHPFYVNKLKEIQKEADIFFLENDDIYSKIVHLIDEIKQTMDKFEIPGIPESWIKANPRLNYFDAAYDVMENDYNLYLKIKESSNLSFRIYPTKEQLKERNAYFKKYKNQTEMDLFEKEVCIDFRKIYYQEFKEYLHETNES